MAKEKTINVIVIGTNDFDDYAFFEGKLYEKLEKYFEQDYKIVIREQEANATDGFAVKFSKENGCELERYKIQWDTIFDLLTNDKKISIQNSITISFDNSPM